MHSMKIELTLSLSRGSFLTLESLSIVCVDRAVCPCCNSKTGISAALSVMRQQDWQLYNLSMKKLQYSYVHRKQDSK